MDAQFKIFLNPSAGASRSKKVTWEELKSAFAAQGCAAEVHVLTKTDCVKDLIDQAEAEGCRGIVSAGGDGTVRSIATAMVGRKTPLGILPLGTFNNTARNLCIPLDLEEAVKCVCHGKVTGMDVGKSSDNHYFLEAAGVGLDAALFPIGEEVKSGRFGRLLEAFRIAFSYRPKRIALDIVDHTGATTHLKTRAIWILIANGIHYGSNIEVSPEASLYDGLLTVKIIHRFSAMNMLVHFLAVILPIKPSLPKFTTYEIKSIRMESHSRVPFHVDGEKSGNLPIMFEVLPLALNVII
ncbi:MAG: diacylglycerol kinase family protein [Chthoniobacterales bacterium]